MEERQHLAKLAPNHPLSCWSPLPFQCHREGVVESQRQGPPANLQPEATSSGGLIGGPAQTSILGTISSISAPLLVHARHRLCPLRSERCGSLAGGLPGGSSEAHPLSGTRSTSISFQADSPGAGIKRHPASCLCLPWWGGAGEGSIRL